MEEINAVAVMEKLQIQGDADTRNDEIFMERLKFYKKEFDKISARKSMMDKIISGDVVADIESRLDKINSFVFKGLSKVHTPICVVGKLKDKREIIATTRGLRFRRFNGDGYSYPLNLEEWFELFTKKYSVLKRYFKKKKPKMLLSLERLKSAFDGLKEVPEIFYDNMKNYVPIENGFCILPRDDDDDNDNNEKLVGCNMEAACGVIDDCGDFKLFVGDNRWKKTYNGGYSEEGISEIDDDFREAIFVMKFHKELNAVLDRLEQRLNGKYKSFFEWREKMKKELAGFECLMNL